MHNIICNFFTLLCLNLFHNTGDLWESGSKCCSNHARCVNTQLLPNFIALSTL